MPIKKKSISMKNGAIQCSICGKLHNDQGNKCRCEKKCRTYGGRVLKTNRHFKQACDLSQQECGDLTKTAHYIEVLKAAENAKTINIINNNNNIQTQNVTNNAEASNDVDVQALQHEIEQLRLDKQALESRLAGDSKPPLEDVLYILQTRHFYESGWDVYKVGRTTNLHVRKHGYPKGSRVIMYYACGSGKALEKKVLSELRSLPLFKERKDFGSEYFECPLHALITKVSAIYTESEEGVANY